MAKVYRYSSQHLKEMHKLLELFRPGQGAREAFDFFLEYWALEMRCKSLTATKDQYERLESLTRSMSKKEFEIGVEATSLLFSMFESEMNRSGPKDLLGELYMSLGMSSKGSGQYFTPPVLAELMAIISLGDAKSLLERKGFLSTIDPHVGSGCLLCAFAKMAYQTSKVNYQTELYLEGIDIDMRCVWMSYIQLSLYGIPARIFHGNSMTMELYSEWPTLMYIIGNWKMRIKK